MANPQKQDLSKALAEMKFMKRHSGGGDFDVGGALTDKWIAPNVPNPPQTSFTKLIVNESYVEFEDLNRLGRFSFNKHNKEVEHLMTEYKRQWDTEGEDDEECAEDEREVSVKALEMAKRYEASRNGKRRILGKRKKD